MLSGSRLAVKFDGNRNGAASKRSTDMNHFYKRLPVSPLPSSCFRLRTGSGCNAWKGTTQFAALIMFVPVVAYYAFVIVGITHFRALENEHLAYDQGVSVRITGS